MWSAAGVAVMAAAALGGCSGDADPIPSSTPPASTSVSASGSTSPSPSDSPSPTYSVPPEAQHRTDAGAIAFVQFYFDQVNEAWATPDPDLIRILSGSDCNTCKADIKTAETLSSDGQRASGPSVQVGDFSSLPGPQDSQMFVDLHLVQLDTPVLDKAGTEVSRPGTGEAEIRALVTWREDKWVMDAIGQR